MPAYEYICDLCGHYIYTIQKITDDKISKCPNCNKNSLERQISSSTFHLKGKGWSNKPNKS